MNGEKGFCRLDDRIHLAWAGLHFGEEPCFSGKGGTANFFFHSCNMACVYCQNHQISQDSIGDNVITPECFAEKALCFQKTGANFIGLVSPSHQAPQIAEAVVMAKREGVVLPIIYNTSGYDSVGSLELFENLVDIYLPDTKYASDEKAKKYSGAEGYIEASRRAILEMYRQAGDIIINPKTGLAQKGMWVRHLVLPGNIAGTFECLKFLATEVSKKIGISIMAQYAPLNRAKEYPEIGRIITGEEYENALDIAYMLGFETVLSQDIEDSALNAVPDFKDKVNPFKYF